LARLQRELNMTFIMVTHDQDEALALSHRIAVFCLGNLEQVGSPEQVYSAPATKFVAEFIGRTNLLPCTYGQSSQDRHAVTLSNGTVLGASSAGDIICRSGDSCYICIKPHAVRLHGEERWASQREESTGFLRGVIRAANYKGTCTEYFVEAEGMQLRAELQHNSDTAALAPGSSVVLTFNDESAWLLKDQPASADVFQEEAVPSASSPAPATRST
jgi:ABC-type Fe3+/spermidine/putrescine transport system ATPase subunit